MANTYVDYTATAGQTDFNFSFPYLEDSHVVVEVEGVSQTLTTNYTIETSPAQKIVLSNPTTALAGGELVRIKRVSDPSTDLVDFVNGSILTETELDRAYLHNRYLAEEAYDGVNAGLGELEGSTNYNANNKQIKNLADGTLATDAVNKGYVDTQIALTDTNLAGFYKSTHTGNGTDNVFTLSFTPQTTDAKAYIVSIDGLVQVPDTDYTIGATDITFDTIPTNLSEICVVATAAASVTTVNEAQVTATSSTTARSLANRFGDVFNVKDFGAVGNGSDDDTDEIQAAITAAYNARTVSEAFDTVTVFIPEGIYIVSNTITVPSYITLKGDGHNSVLKVKDNCTSGFNVLEISENSANNINFNDFAIHGNSANNTQVIKGISIKPVAGSVIYSNFNNLYIKECTGYAIETLNDGAERVRFNDCLFRDCVQHNVYSQKLQYSSFNNCVIRTSKTGYSGVVLDGTNNQIIAFNSCLIEENASYGLYSDRASRINLEGCRFLGNFGTAIYLLKSDTINITDCQFSSNRGIGALLEGASGDELVRVHVSNNMFDGNYFEGLYLNYCTAGSITDNIFSSNSQSPVNTYSGLFIKQSDHISVLSNTFTGTSQKYAIELGSAVTESYLYDNSIVEFGTDRINPTAQNTDNKIEINKFGQSSVIPASGTWFKGDIVWNEDPQSGEYVGWICTVGGTPGTWKEFGLIQA